MAKKKINVVATAITLATVGVIGWGVWQFIIKPRRQKKIQESLIAGSNEEILDSTFEIVENEDQFT